MHVLQGYLTRTQKAIAEGARPQGGRPAGCNGVKGWLSQKGSPSQPHGGLHRLGAVGLLRRKGRLRKRLCV